MKRMSMIDRCVGDVSLVVNTLLGDGRPRLVVEVLAAEAYERGGDVGLGVPVYPGGGLLEELLHTPPGLVQEQDPAGQFEHRPEHVHGVDLKQTTHFFTEQMTAVLIIGDTRGPLE